MKREKPDTLATLFKTDTLADGSIHTRVQAALQRLDEAISPLKGTSYDNDAVNHTGGHSDPTGNLALQSNEYERTRNRLQQLILDRHNISQDIHAIVGNWAPQHAPTQASPAENMIIWCANHLMHGAMEPRGGDGGQHCTWCRDIKSRYGKLPTKELVKLKGKRGKIDDGTYRRLLGKKAA